MRGWGNKKRGGGCQHRSSHEKRSLCMARQQPGVGVGGWRGGRGVRGVCLPRPLSFPPLFCGLPPHHHQRRNDARTMERASSERIQTYITITQASEREKEKKRNDEGSFLCRGTRETEGARAAARGAGVGAAARGRPHFLLNAAAAAVKGTKKGGERGANSSGRQDDRCV